MVKNKGSMKHKPKKNKKILFSLIDGENICLPFPYIYIKPPSMVSIQTNIFHSPIYTVMAASSTFKSVFQNLKRFFKKPWEITGPCSDPEFRPSLPRALEYRPFCPATPNQKACIPSSNPETVYDIKYFTRDQRRNRPPIRRTILKKPDVEKMMKEKTFDVSDFPRVYLTAKVEEDYNARGGGYQK